MDTKKAIIPTTTDNQSTRGATYP